MVAKVTQAISKKVRAQQVVLAAGFAVEDLSQCGNENVDGSHIGLAIWKKEKRIKKLFFLRWQETVNLYLAEVWFQSPARGANSKNVLMHVFGAQHQESMNTLAHLISQEIDTNIHIRLETLDEMKGSPYME